MIIITGAGGFIGSCLLGALKNEEVIAVDDFDDPQKQKNIASKKAMDFWSQREFYQRIDNKISGCEAIIHMGAISSTREENYSLLLEKNYECAKKIYAFCLKNNTRLIYASSAAVYGKGKRGFRENSMNRQITKYGYTKYLFDTWMQSREALRQCVGLRFFNVYGPNEYHKHGMHSIIYQFYHSLKRNGSVEIYKPDSSENKIKSISRDFIYIKDVLPIITFFLENDCCNGIFNVGTGTSSTYEQAAAAVAKAMDVKDYSVHYTPMDSKTALQYQFQTQACIDKLLSEGGPAPKYSLEEGVKDYVEHYLKHDDYY